MTLGRHARERAALDQRARAIFDARDAGLHVVDMGTALVTCEAEQAAKLVDAGIGRDITDDEIGPETREAAPPV